MPELTLFVDAYWCSPFDLSCFLALRQKGLEFSTSRVIMRAGQGLPALYRDRTVVARVPALAHGDFWLSESLAVVEYLEEAFPPPEWPRLLPEELRARARHRQVMSFLRSELGALRQARESWRVVYPAELPAPELGKQARFEADELIDVARRLLAAGELDVSSQMAAELTFALLRLHKSGDAVPGELVRFVNAVCARPAMDEFLAHERPPNRPTDR